MKSKTPAYIENKDFSGLFFRFSVLFGQRRVDVFIWKNVHALRRNTYFEIDDYLGAYVDYPYRKKTRGLFGEIHLIKRLVGAGYVAHEIEHFLYDWFVDRMANSKKGYVHVINHSNEPMAKLAGDFTRGFWDAYYKISRRKKS